MAASTRIKATNILFKIGSTDYSCDANAIELSIEDAPGDVQTFCEMTSGKQWKIKIDGITSLDSASLYQLLFANYNTEVAFTIAPAGNATASTTEPHYTGTVKFDELPPFTMTANEVSKFSVSLTVKNAVHTPAATPPVYYGLTKKTS